MGLLLEENHSIKQQDMQKYYNLTKVVSLTSLLHSVSKAQMGRETYFLHF